MQEGQRTTGTAETIRTQRKRNKNGGRAEGGGGAGRACGGWGWRGGRDRGGPDTCRERGGTNKKGREKAEKGGHAEGRGAGRGSAEGVRGRGCCDGRGGRGWDMGDGGGGGREKRGKGAKMDFAGMGGDAEGEEGVRGVEVGVGEWVTGDARRWCAAKRVKKSEKKGGRHRRVILGRRQRRLWARGAKTGHPRSEHPPRQQPRHPEPRMTPVATGAQIVATLGARALPTRRKPERTPSNGAPQAVESTPEATTAPTDHARPRWKAADLPEDDVARRERLHVDLLRAAAALLGAHCRVVGWWVRSRRFQVDVGFNEARVSLNRIDRGGSRRDSSWGEERRSWLKDRRESESESNVYRPAFLVSLFFTTAVVDRSTKRGRRTEAGLDFAL
ncbi:hypothetical protein C8R47DRAFT_1082301 [Mycena vitilis]|nr:hypothetical protein C8R47DRAFT_1082301 [Mycena vitilis]